MMQELTIPVLYLGFIFAFVAFFYASVGLAGGSSYIALLAIFGAGATTIPIVSLTLNVLVTTVGSIVFLWKKHARIRLIVPFLLTSIPMAYVGGMIQLPKLVFYLVLQVSLIFAAIRIYFPGKPFSLKLTEKGKILLALFCGAILGLVAGIAGIGGGIYLVPLIIILGIGTEKEAAACGSFFIWANSVSGLMARMQYNSIDLFSFVPLMIGVFAGGLAGSIMGAKYFNPRTMQKILGMILFVAIFFLSRKIIYLIWVDV